MNFISEVNYFMGEKNPNQNTLLIANNLMV